MAPSTSTKIVSEIASLTFGPLGMEKHKSRMWLDDHGWWLIGVALESPAYAEGLRPTLFADFLWNAQDHLVFSVQAPLGTRKPDHLYGCDWDEDPDRFSACCTAAVAGIANDVVTWRREYPDLAAWGRHLKRTREHEGVSWSRFDFAVARGLTGDPNAARAEFVSMADARRDDDVDFVQAMCDDIVDLIPLLDDLDAFIDEMRGRAVRKRKHLGLAEHPLGLKLPRRRWRRRR